MLAPVQAQERAPVLAQERVPAPEWVPVSVRGLAPAQEQVPAPGWVQEWGWGLELVPETGQVPVLGWAPGSAGAPGRVAGVKGFSAREGGPVLDQVSGLAWVPEPVPERVREWAQVRGADHPR